VWGGIDWWIHCSEGWGGVIGVCITVEGSDWWVDALQHMYLKQF